MEWYEKEGFSWLLHKNQIITHYDYGHGEKDGKIVKIMFAKFKSHIHLDK